MSVLKRVIKRFGGRTALAKKLGVTPQAVHKWEKGEIPTDRAIQIEQMTDGDVTIRQLRPDLYETTAA